METPIKIDVYAKQKKVGTIAPYNRYQCAFEYDSDWLRDGFSISPFSLPLETGVKIAKAMPFEGLFGVFYDSLPDGWGRLLTDRMLRREGYRPEEINAFSRLSIVGDSGRGLLTYKPVFKEFHGSLSADMDVLAAECRKILNSEQDVKELDTIFAMGGSSGGARPKVSIKADGREWLVKFPSSYDPPEIGLMEYEYNLCARECGIEIPEVKLFHSDKCPGYFGSVRFDRDYTARELHRVHIASASALLEVSHQIPQIDYTTLLALTWQLTRNIGEMKKMFRLMCFNVFAHNRDDHSNNFSFICRQGKWALSPAYDLTYSASAGGEHATTVAGEGKNPEMQDILTVARNAGLREKDARRIAKEVSDIVHDRLGKWLEPGGRG